MNKKRMTGKRFCRTIAVLMMSVLAAMTALPALSEVTVSAAEKTKNTVQLRIGGKKMTKKTYRMRQGTKEKLKVTGKKMKSVRFRSSKKRVVSVSKEGVIRAKKAGTAKITAVVKTGTSGSKQGKRTVWMKVQVVKSQNSNATPKPNETQIPTATDRPANTAAPTDTPTAAPSDTETPNPTVSPIPAETSTPTAIPTPFASVTPPASSTPSLDNGKILIAYFTRSGNAETLADRIQEKTGGTKCKIETVKTYPQDYSGVYDEAMKEQQENARPKLKTRVDNMAEYDTVFVGYPIWHGDAPMAIRTFLESYDFTGKKVIPFCSSGSSRPETSFASVRASAAGAEILDDGLGILQKNEEEEIVADKIHITAGDTTFTATLAGNSSAEALKELLSGGPLTIQMSDYASMEKVGPIGTNLPRNDEHIVTEAGDIILYQGNSLVIYYDTNTWNFTRIGKIEGVTKEQLLAALGTGDVTVIITLAS